MIDDQPFPLAMRSGILASPQAVKIKQHWFEGGFEDLYWARGPRGESPEVFIGKVIVDPN